MDDYTKAQLHDMVRDLEIEMRQLQAKCEWRQIESAPENQWMLVASSNGIVVDIAMLVVEDGDRLWFTEPYKIANRYHRDGTFTHWMPLPMPPNARNQADRPA